MKAAIARAPAPSLDFAVLKGRIKEAGPLDRQTAFSLRSILAKTAAVVGSLAVFVVFRAGPAVDETTLDDFGRLPRGDKMPFAEHQIES